MKKPVRRLALFTVILFGALFINFNYLQVVRSESLQKDPDNTRVLLNEYQNQRGSIIDISGGIDAKRLPAALQGGWADSSLLQLFVPRMLETPEQSLGASTTMLKDLRNVQAFAAQHEVPTPLTSLTEQLFRVLEYQARGQCEPSELLRVFDRS